MLFPFFFVDQTSPARGGQPRPRQLLLVSAILAAVGGSTLKCEAPFHPRCCAPSLNAKQLADSCSRAKLLCQPDCLPL